MSWFSSKSDTAGVRNFYPITSYAKGFGPLTDKDTEWANTTNRGFQTETQVWYSVLEDGSWLMCQIIWSYVGVFVLPATAQFTFKYYNPKTKKISWKSINGSGFKAHGKGCKADQWEIKVTGSAAGEETYSISALLDKHVQVNVQYVRPANAPGFKFGEGETGAISTFGKEKEDGKRDGFVVHRFHPLLKSSGSVLIDGSVIDAKGEAIFIHAIQGMRPDSLATRWNFAFFTSGGGNEDGKLGSVRAIQMEFETTDVYGPKGAKSGRTKVNIGAIYSTALSPVPILAVGQTHHSDTTAYPKPTDDTSSCVYPSSIVDKDTGYSVPTAIEYEWAGERRDGKGSVSAVLQVPQLGATTGEGGLIEKVDVLAEIPYVIRKAVAAVTGTKPYIYQYHNPTTLEVNLGDEKVEVKGWLFNEASFVSE